MTQQAESGVEIGSRKADDLVVADAQLVVEPLIGHFPAWLQLVSPIPSALRLAKTQLPTLQSYLEAPSAHASGAGHPATRGGPFVDCPEEDFALMQELTSQLSAQADLLDLAEQVGALDSLVEKELDGFDLARMYREVPAKLRGYVELFYDLHHRPRFRFREAMLYQSPWSTRTRESIYLTRADGDYRPFILSTPRLSTNRGLVLPLRFDSQAVDLISKSRQVPTRYGDIVDSLGVDGRDEPFIRSLWSSAPPRDQPDPYTGPMRIRYFGHACLVMETAETTLVVDPFISPLRGTDRFSLADLPERIDYCLITHGHADHFVLETLIAIRHKVGTVIVPRNLSGELFDPSLRLCLQQAGFTSIVEVDDGACISFADGEIVAWPFSGEHGDLPICAKTTYLVRLGERSIMVAADTRGGHPVLHQILRREYGPVDDVFLGMECEGAPLTWMYGPLFAAAVQRKVSLSRRLNGSNTEEAVELLASLGARRVFIYAMGEEPWLQHVMTSNYTPDSFQLQQIEGLRSWCRDSSIGFEHLLGKAEIF
jgi:L-ascorbate metabolism protein UlaG (beta-lactamase superfamily)